MSISEPLVPLAAFGLDPAGPRFGVARLGSMRDEARIAYRVVDKRILDGFGRRKPIRAEIGHIDKPNQILL